MTRAVLAATLALLLSSSASAWWDTQVRAMQPLPLVKAVPAADCAGAADLRADPQADGGRGGRAAYLKPGAALTFKADLKRSVYAVWAIARADEKENVPPAEVKQEFELPGGKAMIDCPRPIVYATLRVKFPDGREQTWYMPIAFRNDYAVVTRLYFPLHVNGACEISLGLDARSRIGLLVNRLELRDALGNCARVPAKTRRMLLSDADLAKAREAYAAEAAAARRRPVLAPQREPAARAERNNKLWDSLPALNLVLADPSFRAWNSTHGPVANPQTLTGAAALYEKSGNLEAAWDGAVLLCAVAEKYPGLDHYVASVGTYAPFSSPTPLRWSTQEGKTQYSGHAPRRLMEVATAYDQLFDFIRDNQDLADYVRTRIPWVRTPRDVIELLDTNLLQHGMDSLNRRVLRSDVASAFIPLIQGVNDVSRRMLEDGLFRRVHFNMADAGGLDDQVFTSFSRGGVHYIGATGYVGPALTEIAEVLEAYCAAGGDPKFNMNNVALYPHMPEAEKTKQKLYAAGGFPIIIGDSMDLRRGREAKIPAYPSRVIEGFGCAVLESGQDRDNPLQKQAVAMRTGIGRGHAHQDTLNIEVFAHGVRLAPDLGGRHEGKNVSSPNMRINRMHNVVEVDERNFDNTCPGSTVGATGWTTAFSPQPGAQYMAGAARATSHPNVSLYQRSTAMIEGDRPDLDVYLFDVFRVAGGKTHTYCFHGGPTADENRLDINIPLAPVASEIARNYLKGRPPASQFEGRSGDPLVATWTLSDDLRKRYQGAGAAVNAPVAISLSLFGRPGEHVMVGSASSQVYPVAMPYLHLQGRSEAEGRASVYPALYEMYSGKPFLGEKRALKVTPASEDARAPVALQVAVGDGRRDLLFSSLKPDVLHQVEDGARIAGEFAFLSRDADGLRALHLVGGTELTRDGIGVRCPTPAHQGVIQSVNYLERSLTLSTELPALLLDGQVALLGNERHWAEFEIEKAAGRQARLVRTPRFYQSPIEFVAPAQRLVATELEPLVYGADKNHCDGVTVANESHTRLWRASLEPRERWMSLAWPGTDLSYSRVVTWDDLPDANGDGKRTLRLLAGAADERRAARAAPRADGEEDEGADAPAPPPRKAGDVLLELEVTRVDPANNLFYFKMPSDAAYQEGGWQYANRELVNEDGSKKWYSGYPGTTFSWELEGREPFAETDFDDADKDGKRKLYAYHYGPGDTFTVKTFAHLRRVEKNLYQLRANTPCTLILPGKAPVAVSRDGENFQPASAQRSGANVSLSLAPADLASGALFIRTSP